MLDGIVFLSSCDKTTPAHCMAAARLNVPSIVLTCGYQLGGQCMAGEFVDIDDVYEAIGSVACGSKTFEELVDMTNHAITTPGVCAGLGTANSMHIVAEGLGMALPGNAPILADSAKLYVTVSWSASVSLRWLRTMKSRETSSPKKQSRMPSWLFWPSAVL